MSSSISNTRTKMAASRAGNHCTHCLKAIMSQRTLCTKCEQSYCSKLCFDNNEPTHKYVCGVPGTINPAVKTFGFDQIIAVFNALPIRKIISVGSGSGTLEEILNRGDFHVYTVEPEPGMWNDCAPDLVARPTASSVSELLTTRPDIFNNFILLLNFCLPNASSYDMDAITATDPSIIVAIVESLGGAGGDAFWGWINEQEIYDEQRVEPERERGYCHHSIIVLQKKSRDVVQLPREMRTAKSFYKQKDCSIQ